MQSYIFQLGMAQNATSLNQCTFKVTGTNMENQNWRRCFDCFPDPNEGACLICCQLCHDGHKLGELQFTPFYCDCGEQKCCKTAIRPWRNPSKQKGEEPKKVNATPPMWVFDIVNQPQPGPINWIPPTNPARDGMNPSMMQDQMETDEKPINPADHANFSNTSMVLSEKIFNIQEVNRVFSPLSLGFALSIVHEAALAKTEQEITNLFGRKHSLKEMTCAQNLFNSEFIKMCNALVVNENMNVKKAFLDLFNNIAWVTAKSFDKPMLIIEECNQFIETNTNGMIKDVLKPEDVASNTIAILINTIYFKANWKHKFQKNSTQKQKFNDVLEVDMMYQAQSFRYYEDEFCQMIELPYVGDQFCMNVLLPKNRNPLALPKLDVHYLNTCIGKMTDYKIINVYLPKFKHRKQIDGIPIMKKLGVNDLFQPGDCNLDKMCKNVFVSVMKHEAVVIVDEEGTEAAAMTVIGMRECTSVSFPTVFNANHSFIYIIRHIPTHTILFVGDYHGN